MRIGKSIIVSGIITSMVMLSTAAVAADGQSVANKLSVASSPAVKAVRVGGLKNKGKSNFAETPVLVLLGVAATAGVVAVAASSNGGSPASP